MPNEITAVTAFVIGLLGSVHCLGMCGGIVTALTLGLPADTRQSPTAMLAYLLAYNVGRISSYALAGALAGVLGAQFYSLTGSQLASQIGHWLAGAFMIALGFYLAGWTRVLAPLEKAGQHLWRRIEPFGKRFLPVHKPTHALGLGLVWGWLPCGLVYSALVWAILAGDPLRGAQVMVAFGLGTLPMLLTMGAAATWLSGLVRQNAVRRGAGVLIMLFGLAMVFAPQLLHQNHWQHMHTHQH